MDKLDTREIERLEDAFVREVAASPGRLASPQTTFNYAWALAHSPDRADVERCIPLAERLLRDCPEYYRDCNYLLAEAHFQLGHYTEARTYNDALLALEPHNQQARRLHEQIARQLTQEGTLGLALLMGGALTATALGVAAALLRSRR